MSRKTIIYSISVIMICTGLVQIWRFFSPLFGAGKSMNLTLILSGAFVLSAGWNLLKLNTTGRELAFWILFMNLLGGLLVLGFILPVNGIVSINVQFLDKPVFNSVDERLFSIVFLAVFLAIDLSALVFLEQEKTKKLFTPDLVENLTSKADAESKSTSEK